MLKDKAHKILGLNPGATVEEVEKTKQCCLLWCLGRGDQTGRLMSLKAACFVLEEDKRGSLHGCDDKQLVVCKTLARSSNFGADEVTAYEDPMPELIKCRVRVGGALRENHHQLSELDALKESLSKQEGYLVDTDAVFKALPNTIQMLWSEFEIAKPGPTTLRKLKDLLDALKVKVNIVSKDGEFVLPLQDAAWIVNLAQLSHPQRLSQKLREHMLTPLHASLTSIEPVNST